MIRVLQLIDQQSAQATSDHGELAIAQHSEDKLLKPGEVREIVAVQVVKVVIDGITKHLLPGPGSSVSCEIDPVVAHSVGEVHYELEHVRH